MTLTNKGRLARFTAIFAGAIAMIALAFGAQSSQASAADVVGNPGNFTATWNGGTFQYGNQAFTPSGSFNMTVNANGTFTTSGMTFAGQGAPDVNNGNVKLQQVTLTPQVPAAWTGTINPVTGAISFNGQMQIQLYSNRSGYITDLITNTGNTTCLASQPTNVNPAGTNYNFNTGTANISFGPFTGAAANTCNARNSVIGGGTANQATAVNNTYGMNGSNNSITASLTIRNGANEGIRPWPVRPTFTVSPDPVGVGDTATFNASASGIDNGLQACAGPSVSDADCGYRWDFNGDGVIDEVTNGPTVTHVYNAPANETPKLTIFDTQGKSDTFTGSVWVQSKPEAQIDTTPPAVTKETVNSFIFSIPANPYTATTQCSVDGASFTACNSGDNFTFVQSDDTTGSHNFRVRGITPGGVAGPVAQYSFTIDRVKPRVTINTKPVNPTNSTSASFTFTADKPNTTLECQLDGGSWVACGTNSTGSRSYGSLTQSSPTPIEAPNPHEFRVRATDQYGNVGGDGNPGGGAYDWDIDLTSPVPSFDVKPANPSNDVSPTFVWENNEAIQLAQCRLAINGTQGAWQNCGSLTTKSLSTLADGSYAFGVRTLDIAGNWSNPITHSWNLETVTPPLSITGTPAKFSNRTSAQFLFTTEAGATTRCQLDARPVQDPCPSGVKYSYLAAGSHIFSVTSTDPALNETTRTYTWDIKTAKPVVQIEADSVPATSSTEAEASFELTTANGDAECRLDGGSWSACQSNSAQSYPSLTDGNHTFEVRAVDEFDNVSAVDSYSWLVVANAPEVNFGLTPDANTNRSTGLFSFAVGSADPNIKTVCSLDGGDGFPCGSPAAVTKLTDGSHTFEVTATDTAGQTDTASYSWNVKAKIPGLGFDAAPASLAKTTGATFEFSSDEDPDVSYECRTDNGSFSACASPVALTGLAQGEHSFTVRATDSVGNRATEAYIWKVDSIAPVVTFDRTPPATTTNVAELISFASSEADVSFECKLDAGSFSACSSPALVKNLATGAHTFEVRATDAAGNVSSVVSTAWVIEAPAAVVNTQGTGGNQTGNAAAPKVTNSNNLASPASSKQVETKSSTAKPTKKASKSKKKSKKSKKSKSKSKKAIKAGSGR